MNPWVLETPPLLTAYKPLVPDGQQHTLQLTAKEVVKVVDTDRCVAMKSLVPISCRKLGCITVLFRRALGELLAKAEAPSREMCLAKLHIVGLSDSFHNILGTN